MILVFGVARIRTIHRCKLDICLVDSLISKHILFELFRLLFVSYTNREGLVGKEYQDNSDEAEIKPLPI